jgi:hypothetical protein
MRTARDPKLIAFKNRSDAATQCADARLQRWVERARRLPSLSSRGGVATVQISNVAPASVVRALIVETYLARVDSLGIASGAPSAGDLASEGADFGRDAHRGDSGDDETVFACLARAVRAWNAKSAPPKRVGTPANADDVLASAAFFADASRHRPTDAKCELFARFCGLSSGGASAHLSSDAFDALARVVRCARELMGTTRWEDEFLARWRGDGGGGGGGGGGGRATLPMALVLDVVANVLNVNDASTHPFIARVRSRDGASSIDEGVDFDRFLSALIDHLVRNGGVADATATPRRFASLDDSYSFSPSCARCAWSDPRADARRDVACETTREGGAATVKSASLERGVC